MKPTQILAKLCKDGKIDGPSYSNGKVKLGRQTFFLQADDSDCNLNTKGNSKLNFLKFVILLFYIYYIYTSNMAATKTTQIF
jgi:hypothetical protein